MKLGLMLFFILSTSLYAQINPDLPNPSELTQAYLDEISKREIGQTRFAVKERQYPRAQTSQQQQQEQSSGGRDIQESDVYKLGKKGKKELFLLNRHRGFQVVSFEDGLAAPKLIGRFPVYNNWSSEMYYLEKEDKVLVVNTEWSFGFNHWQTNYNTVLYLLDVANSEEPKIIKEVNVPGYLQESRMVGDVLYTITNNGAWNEMKAQITSIKIAGDALQTVDQEELHGENRWVRTMNVVKDGEKFYVISTLSDWRNRGDYINVHDITSEQGKIEKLFTAKARGEISERSQTFLHKNFLFAVSNYQASENARMRVSVEAFPLNKTSEVIESRPNMRASVGDTNGQHASLQDVRVSGDMLYAFWVPANNIDPFDLFDISDPAKGIKHLGQLQFDGWISKAFPLEHASKKYVLGLGWIVPATSENNRRYPQAKLFEIKKTERGVKHEVVASLTLDREDVWASLNDLDKFFEIIEEAPGVYNILFPVTFSRDWKSGAKIVTADLNASKLEEGASIIGSQGWLNRVFLNREVRAINTFSDLSLETFDQDDISSHGIARTVSILELARNIVDFHVINEKEGIQIISHEKSVEIRKTSLDMTDAEKNATHDQLLIPGIYQWHKIKGNRLFLISSVNRILPRTSDDDYWQEERFDHANLTVLDLLSSEMSSQRIDIKPERMGEYFYFQVESTSTKDLDVFTMGGDFFKLNDTTLEKLAVAQDCKYFFNSDSHDLSLQSVGNDIFAFNMFKVKAPGSSRTISYSMPFMKKLNLSRNEIACSQSINVPGRPVLMENNFLVTSDTQRMYYYPRGINYEYLSIGYPYRSSSKTFSLRFKNAAEAELVDILNKDITSGLFQDGFVTYTSADSRIDIWSLSTEGQLVSRPHYLDYNRSKNTSLITLREFNGRNFLFMKNEKKVDLFELTSSKRLSRVPVTSSFDLDEEDESAEFIFAIEDIDATIDLTKLIISQGYYGVTELIIK